MVTCIHNGHIRAPSLLMFTQSLKVQVTVSEKAIENFKSHDIVKFITIYLFFYFFLCQTSLICPIWMLQRSSLGLAYVLICHFMAITLIFSVNGTYLHSSQNACQLRTIQQTVIFASFSPSTILNIKVINMAFHQ